MNILAFVLALIMIFTFSAAASFQNHLASRRILASFIGLRKAERNLLRQTETAQFRALEGEVVKPQAKARAPKPKEEKPVPIPAVNPSCARLNLFPLLDQGREAHPALYEQAAKILRLFYASQLDGIEYQLLDSLIASAKLSLKEKESLPLETISLSDSSLQPLYYLLLKGKKNPDLFASKGYPSLVDYFKIERAVQPICLFHAHPHLLASFFGLKPTLPLYEKLHREVKSGIELEALLFLAGDPTLSLIDPAVWTLLDLNRPSHKKLPTETFLAEDKESGISIRQTINRT